MSEDDSQPHEQDDANPTGGWHNRPRKSRYSLPAVLKELSEEFGATREDLAQYIYDSSLRAVCFPYVHDRDRAVEVDPLQLKGMWRDPWAFSVFAEHIGDMPLSDFVAETEPLPLAILPAAVGEDLWDEVGRRIVGRDGKPIVESAVIYVLYEDLAKFMERGAVPPRRPGETISPEHKNEGGRPSYKIEIEEASLSLLDLNEINHDTPWKVTAQKVREQVMKDVETDDGRGLDDQTIRRHLMSIMDAHGKTRS